jgi:hypothetical protein
MPPSDPPKNTTDGRLRGGLPGKEIVPAVLARASAAVGVAAAAFRDSWFGPGRPVAGAIPEGGSRGWEYPPGINILSTPRATEAISFGQLRSLANLHDLTRLAIETRKDQVCKLDHSFRPKRRRGESKAAVAQRANDPRIEEISKFFERPGNAVYYPPEGGRPEIVPTNWTEWLRALLEDVLVIDAPAIAITRSLGGTPFSWTSSTARRSSRAWTTSAGPSPISNSSTGSRTRRSVRTISFTARGIRGLTRSTASRRSSKSS